MCQGLIIHTIPIINRKSHMHEVGSRYFAGIKPYRCFEKEYNRTESTEALNQVNVILDKNR